MDTRERLIKIICNSLNGCPLYKAERIADGLIANGAIIPPCKVGDVVYATDAERVYSSTIRKVIYDTDNFAFDEDAIGKAVFLNIEEAQTKSKEMEKKI